MIAFIPNIYKLRNCWHNALRHGWRVLEQCRSHFREDRQKNKRVVEVISCRFLITLTIFFSTSFSAYSENTRISVFIDKPFYTQGQIPKIFVSGVNREIESQIVDIHVGLIDPSGRIYEYPDWNTSFSPWLPLFELSSGFEFPAALVADATDFPGGITPGLWHAGVALTKAGTLEFLSVQTVPFTMLFEKM